MHCAEPTRTEPLSQLRLAIIISLIGLIQRKESLVLAGIDVLDKGNRRKEPGIMVDRSIQILELEREWWGCSNRRGTRREHGEI